MTIRFYQTGSAIPKDVLEQDDVQLVAPAGYREGKGPVSHLPVYKYSNVTGDLVFAPIFTNLKDKFFVSLLRVNRDTGELVMRDDIYDSYVTDVKRDANGVITGSTLHRAGSIQTDFITCHLDNELKR